MMTLSACVVSPDGQPSGSIQIPVPVVITESPKIIIVDKKDTAQSQSIHVCQIQAFTQTYAAEDTNKGKAKLQAKKQCLAEFHSMHCGDEKITCKEYK